MFPFFIELNRCYKTWLDKEGSMGSEGERRYTQLMPLFVSLIEFRSQSFESY